MASPKHGQATTTQDFNFTKAGITVATEMTYQQLTESGISGTTANQIIHEVAGVA